jgi:hypothetical protein
MIIQYLFELSLLLLYAAALACWLHRAIPGGGVNRGPQAKCGGVRPNWKEQPGMPDSWQGRAAWDE